MATPSTKTVVNDLVRTALQQQDFLDQWLCTNLLADQRVIFETLMTLENWRRAVWQPAPPNVERDRALVELAGVTARARTLIEGLGNSSRAGGTDGLAGD